jgi:hypothetical protein
MAGLCSSLPSLAVIDYMKILFALPSGEVAGSEPGQGGPLIRRLFAFVDACVGWPTVPGGLGGKGRRRSTAAGQEDAARILLDDRRIALWLG